MVQCRMLLGLLLLLTMLVQVRVLVHHRGARTLLLLLVVVVLLGRNWRGTRRGWHGGWNRCAWLLVLSLRRLLLVRRHWLRGRLLMRLVLVRLVLVRRRTRCGRRGAGHYVGAAGRMYGLPVAFEIFCQMVARLFELILVQYNIEHFVWQLD